MCIDYGAHPNNSIHWLSMTENGENERKVIFSTSDILTKRTLILLNTAIIINLKLLNMYYGLPDNELHQFKLMNDELYKKICT
jgi:hypothetical protein